jgi:CRISPR-associated protein Cas6/Cse3/CasE subtype I-E
MEEGQMIEAIFRIPTADTLYQAHQHVWSVVSPNMNKKRDFLFRVRQIGGVSLAKVRGDSLPVSGMPVSPLLAWVSYRFCVLVNPVKREGSRETPLRAETEIVRWVESRLAAGGIAPDVINIDFLPSQEFGKPGYRHRVHTVEATGTARVVDGEKAMRLLVQGVGRGRGIGFGMLEMEKI